MKKISCKRIAVTSIIISMLLFSAIPYNVTYSTAYSNSYGTISYDSGTNTITVTGNSSDGDAWGFYDIWHWCNVDPGGNASLVNSTDSNATNEGTQYYFTAKLQIGDGTTVTYFKDTNKQVTFADAVLSTAGDKAIRVRNNAHFTLGNLDDAVNKYTSKGCSIGYKGSAPYACYIIYGEIAGGDETNIYSSHFWGEGYSTGMYIRYCHGNFYNSIFTNLQSLYQCSGDFYNLLIEKTAFGFLGCDGTFDKLYVTDISTGLYLTIPQTLTNVIIREASYKYINFHYKTGGDVNIQDSELEDWTILWWYGNETTAKLNRQYTFNPIITDTNGNPITNANVVLEDKYDNVVIDDTTDANGRILNGTEPYVVTYAFYNQTGGNTPYLQSPHHLIITKAGYATYETNITIDHPIIDDAFVLGSDLQAEIYNYLQQKWGEYNASQFWQYLEQMDTNITQVYQLLQLVNGNLTDVMNLLQLVDGNVTLIYNLLEQVDGNVTTIYNLLDMTDTNITNINSTVNAVYSLLKKVDTNLTQANLTLQDAYNLLKLTDNNVTEVYDLLVLVDGNVTATYNLLQSVNGNIDIIKSIVQYINNTRWHNLTAWDLYNIVVNYSYSPQNYLAANFDYHNFANGSIQFIDTSLSSSQIINWTWNISNTTYYTQNPVVTFDKRQTINVTLTVTDVYNNTNSTSKNVTVYIKSFTPYQFVMFISVLSLLSMFTSIYIFRKEEDENLRKLNMTKSLIFAMLSGIGWIITAAISISIGIPYEVVYRNVVISDWNVVTSNSIPIFFFGIGIVCIVWTVYLIMDILRTSVPSSHPAYTKWFRWKR